jgi:three-Cys-motif partner protein
MVDYLLSRADGLPVRPSGPWAVEKLTYVAKYQDIFATGMKKWRDRFYVDLLAGPGRCINRESSEEFDGSPVRSLGVRFTTRIFIEADPLLASALRTRVGVGPILIADDCTKSTVIEQVRKETSGRDRLGLAFVDNLGLDVPFATLAALTSDRRIDLMITFQVGDLTRNIPNVLDGREDPGRFDRFFGSTGWQAVAAESMRRNASAGETATVLLDFYAPSARDDWISAPRALSPAHEEQPERASVSAAARRKEREGRRVLPEDPGDRPVGAAPPALTGIWTHRMPSSRASSPPRFEGWPPSCFRKNGTPSRRQASRSSRSQSRSRGRHPG